MKYHPPICGNNYGKYNKFQQHTTSQYIVKHGFHGSEWKPTIVGAVGKQTFHAKNQINVASKIKRKK